ncbi:hypothetical protein [Roseibium sp. SCP14]|uniref:hypothetical protein n=1 Tax=Roseibium sp. SCP14 TaxID=3141375 RepID=UPI003337A30E
MAHETVFAGLATSRKRREHMTRNRLGKRMTPLAILALLTGCASTGDPSGLFDYSETTTAKAVEPATESSFKGRTEEPKPKSAETLLGKHQSGSEYTVRPDVANTGRFYVYSFETSYGNYTVTGDALARKHIQELIALAELKKFKRSDELIEGVTESVTGPVKAVYGTVTNPVGTAKGSYEKAKRTVKSVGRNVASASEYVTTFGKPKKEAPERESDGFIEGIFSRPSVKRELAQELKVDPYTHFRPLSDKLDEIASFEAAGSFGVNTAVSFVPGAGGMVISGLQTYETVTDQALDRPPKEIAAVNLERLQDAGVPEETARKFLLSEKFTPTEKVLAVTYFRSVASASGAPALIELLAESRSRSDAYAALQALYYTANHGPSGQKPTHIAVTRTIPVLTFDQNRKIALFAYDELSWTVENATLVQSVQQFAKAGSKSRTKLEIHVSGDVTSLAKTQLKRKGWAIVPNIAEREAEKKSAGLSQSDQ